MGKGNIKTQVNDWINSFDPRVGGLSGKKGSIFRYIPILGLPLILVKQDDGFSTNWLAVQQATPVAGNIYYVVPGGEYPTIQSAIDAAFAAGSGDPGNTATIYIPPGEYVENLEFRPGQSLVAQAANISVGAVKITGQHHYEATPGGDILSKTVLLQGLSFNDNDPGNTITIDGMNDGFFLQSGCQFFKNSATGRFVLCTNMNTILVITSGSGIYFGSTDPAIESYAAVTVVQSMSYSSNAPGPFVLYQGSGTLNFFNNQALTNSPYVLSIESGQAFVGFNFLGTFAPDSDCIRCDGLAYVFNSTLLSSVGTGYVLQGTGTVNGGMLVYGISTAKDPSLTFNLLPSDPS